MKCRRRSKSSVAGTGRYQPPSGFHRPTVGRFTASGSRPSATDGRPVTTHEGKTPASARLVPADARPTSKTSPGPKRSSSIHAAPRSTPESAIRTMPDDADILRFTPRRRPRRRPGAAGAHRRSGPASERGVGWQGDHRRRRCAVGRLRVAMLPPITLESRDLWSLRSARARRDRAHHRRYWKGVPPEVRLGGRHGRSPTGAK
jgi:hypothetical protein